MSGVIRLVIVAAVSVRMALQQIWANKVRAALTTLGIIIGVASVTVVIASVTGLERAVLNEVGSFGANNMYAYPRWPNTGPMANASYYAIRFKPDEFDDLAQSAPSLKAFTRQSSWYGSEVRYREETLERVVHGIEPAWHLVEGRPVLYGRQFTPLDGEARAAVCLVDERVRDELGMPADPTGEDVLIQGRRFRVVGLIEQDDRLQFLRGEPEGELFVPFETLVSTVGLGFVNLAATAVDSDSVEQASGELAFYLRNRRQIAPGEEDTFGIERVDSVLEQVRRIGRILTFSAAGVVGISLLVGGIGIMNIMLVSVSERTREIGLRKAVGARPAVILVQFLVEAIVLCLVGGFVGLAIGQGATLAVRAWPDSPLSEAAIPLWAVVLAFGFSAGVGLIFGMFPAIKASRLDPIVALRHE